MNRWKALLVLLLAMLYLPATGHCLLEQAGWFPSAGDCCEQTPSANGPLTSSCAYGCCPVENIDHHSPNKGGTLMGIDQSPVCAQAWSADVLPQPSRLVSPEFPPPELSKGWQFAYRTALPPRAPSFVS